MFSVDRHLDSYSYKDFKNRKYWLYRKYKGTGFKFNADDSVRLSTLNSGGYSIDKYPAQPIDNERQFYNPGYVGRPAYRQMVINPETGEGKIEPSELFEEHRVPIDTSKNEFVTTNWNRPPKVVRRRLARRDVRGEVRFKPGQYTYGNSLVNVTVKKVDPNSTAPSLDGVIRSVIAEEMKKQNFERRRSSGVFNRYDSMLSRGESFSRRQSNLSRHSSGGLSSRRQSSTITPRVSEERGAVSQWGTLSDQMLVPHGGYK